MEVVKNGQKAEKKPTNEQLQRRIKNAVVFVERDKDTKSVYFTDKGLRITVTIDNAVLETFAHRHVFNAISPSGKISRPYLYLKQFLTAALENDCIVTLADGGKAYSYARLFSVLKDKEDKTEYNICWYADLWMFNIFAPLFEIDETEAGSFLVYERYMHNIARNSVLLEEHKEDVTNKQYVDAVMEQEKSFLEGLDESVILKAKTDEERIKEEMEAIQKDAEEKAMEEQANGLRQE